MALKKLLLIFALTSSLFTGEVVMGQLEIPGPRFRHQQIEETGATRPFAEPGIFDYDAQMFAPVEFSNNKELAPNTGFFFSYERGYTSISRAGNIGTTDTTQVSLGSDWIWGNRFEGGWMNEADRGWDVVYQKAAGSYFAFGTSGLIATPLLVNTDFSQLEINRVFRQALSNGDYFEPYLGLHYYSLSDNSLEDTTRTINGALSTNRFTQNATNSAPGFQCGGRYNARRGRFRYTCDVALVAAYNQQRLHTADFPTIGGAIGTSEQYFTSQSFMPAFDGQIEVAYSISRDIAFRTSFQLDYIWTGVTRTNNLTTNINPNSVFGTGTDFGILETDFIAAGFTFGFEWAR